MTQPNEIPTQKACTDCACAASGDAATCTDCSCGGTGGSAMCNGATTEQKGTCPKCGGELKSGMKYTDICTNCEPIYLKRCSSCERQLWDCMCIHPHRWE